LPRQDAALGLRRVLLRPARKPPQRVVLQRLLRKAAVVVPRAALRPVREALHP
jgi:hypothetical protein